MTVKFKAGLVFSGVMLLFLPCLIFVEVFSRRGEAKYAKLRRAATEKVRADGPPNSREMSLGALWTRFYQVPSIERIGEVLERYPMNDERATIVGLGLVEVPAAGEVHFEPEIITPTTFIGRKIIFAWIALAILFYFLLQILGVIPIFVRNFGAFTYVVVVGIGVAYSWTRRTLVRPTYVRLAPGMIQILEFRFRGGKPTIREYPMTRGTLAVVRMTLDQTNPSLVSLKLSRGGYRDELPINQMSDRVRLTELTWTALLSTAPTPPLPDDALAG